MLRTLPAEPNCQLCRAFALLADELSTLDASAAAAAASASAAAAADGEQTGGDGGRYLRIEVEVHGVQDPAIWLSHQLAYPRVYFGDPQKRILVGGTPLTPPYPTLPHPRDTP